MECIIYMYLSCECGVGVGWWGVRVVALPRQCQQNTLPCGERDGQVNLSGVEKTFDI